MPHTITAASLLFPSVPLDLGGSHWDGAVPGLGADPEPRAALCGPCPTAQPGAATVVPPLCPPVPSPRGERGCSFPAWRARFGALILSAQGDKGALLSLSRTFAFLHRLQTEPCSCGRLLPGSAPGRELFPARNCSSRFCCWAWPRSARVVPPPPRYSWLRFWGIFSAKAEEFPPGCWRCV